MQRGHPFSFNHEEAEAAFRDFEKTLEKFTVKPTHKDGRSYVLSQSLVKWLRSPWPGHKLTQADRLHKAVYHSSSSLFDPISPEQLSTESNGCLLVFSILLVLHKGDLVDRFQRRGIIDGQIPMSLERLQKGIKDMELSEVEASNLSNDFFEKQWLFCPVIISRDMDRDYEKENIMPICQKQKINDKAGSATGIYLIEIQEQFVNDNLKAVAVRYEDIKDGFGYRYQFAQKTFHESKRDLFENEIQAFKALKYHEGMVQYLGRYTHENYKVSSTSDVPDKTYNILLEYGDLDLDEYFYERLPPVFPTEILRFWKDLFEVGDAIEGVHNLKYGKGELAEEYYGWHADIKPDNILSVHGKFKLADPGFAHFVKKTDEIPMGEVLGGTETFGAPECHRSRRRSSNTVHQTIDIWSLGCVFSIAATWVALGYQGILQYAEFRKNAIKKLEGPVPSQLEADLPEENNFSDESKSSEDCFHNGHEVLPEVTSWHKSLRVILRKTDTLTALVLDLIDNKMLLSDPRKRLSAGEACAELRRIYNEAQEAEAEAKFDEKVPEMILDALRQLDDSAPPKTLPKTPSEESSPDLHSRNAKSKRLEEPLKKTTHRSEVFKPEPHLFTQSLADIDESETPVNSTDAEREHFPSSSVAGLGFESPQVMTYPQMHLGQSPVIPYLGTNTTAPSVYDTPPRRFPASSPITSNKPRTPTLSVFDARHQLDESQKTVRGIARKFFGKHRKDDVLSRHFGDRDLLFLVDNAATMKIHWGQAKFLLETLVRKAEGLAPDGPGLRFTMGTHELKRERRASAFKDAMKHPDAIPRDSDVTDIRVSLGKIFDQYLEGLRAPWRGVNLSRALTIIVLTDGLWQGVEVKEEVDEQIVKFVRLVRELTNNVIPRRVSIEFIQFGKDPEATERLRKLDDDLKAREIEDVIDTEPSDGDIYKMLLGSLNESFDGGQNGLEWVESPHGTHEGTSMYMHHSTHTSPSHDGPYLPPTRTATDASQHTIKPPTPTQYPPGSSGNTPHRPYRGAY